MRRLAIAILVALAGCGGGGHAKPAGDHQPAPHAGRVHHAHPHMHHRFDDAEKWSKVFDDPARDAWQKPDEVVRLLELEAGQAVADLGAGTGYFAPHLSRALGAEGRVLALDVEPEMVAHMTKRFTREGLANASAQVVKPDGPGLPAASVDRILVVDTWHHLGDRAAYTKKLAQALKPGGFVMVVDFTLETSRGPPVAARLSPEVVAAELTAGGLTASVSAEALPDQYIVIGRLP